MSEWIGKVIALLIVTTADLLIARWLFQEWIGMEPLWALATVLIINTNTIILRQK